MVSYITVLCILVMVKLLNSGNGVEVAESMDISVIKLLHEMM